MISGGQLVLHGWAGTETTCTVTVQVERRCAACQATGKVYSEAWRHWVEAMNEAENTVGQPWREWPESRRTAWEAAHPEPAESEELMCGECDGRGTLLTRDGQALIDFLRRYLGESK